MIFLGRLLLLMCGGNGVGCVGLRLVNYSGCMMLFEVWVCCFLGLMCVIIIVRCFRILLMIGM